MRKPTSRPAHEFIPPGLSEALRRMVETCPPLGENVEARSVTVPAETGPRAGTIRRGQFVRTSGGAVYQVKSVKKSGLLQLVDASRGFAMFSHASVVSVVPTVLG